MAELSPLCVLLTVMETRWDLGELERAGGLAKSAAPYRHGRALTGRAGGDLAEVPDDELDRWAFGHGSGGD